ncbi:MAG: hypothetical protein QM756_18760 [Polyangiaceae bacterium]
MLREPSEITQVVDAFDEDDPFDLHLSLGYETSWKSGAIRRETSIVQPGLTTGDYTSSGLNVAEYKESTSRLLTRADIGIYRDVALIVRMPIVLSNERELSSLDGSGSQQPLVLQGAPGEQLFTLPFKSPKRSGIEYLALGLDAAIMNQARDRTKPTWLIGIEGRFNISEPMHACNASTAATNGSGTQVKCANISDVNRNGVADGGGEGSFTSKERSSGVSRGVTGLELHSFVSRRVKYVEPYGGFRALFEFQNASSDYGQVDLKGSLVNHPPLRGSMLMGLNVIPWEIRDRFQRLALDFRFTGTYVSEGRDYSELFDALGSSDAPTLRNPNYAEYMAGTTPNTSVVNPASRRVYFTGLTDVQAYGSYTLSTSVTWQAGEFVKFNAGAAYTLTQGHYITYDQACNPDFSGDIGKSGPCHHESSSAGTTAVKATGIPNPSFRKPIDDPGNRFRVDDLRQIDAWINATVMF